MPCPMPPPANIVHAELVKTIQENIHKVDQATQPHYCKYLNHLMTRPGDKEYMLDVLATLTDGTHEYFRKDYRY